MDVEKRDHHECEEEQGTPKHERHMVEKETTALIAVRSEGPNRRSDYRFHR